MNRRNFIKGSLALPVIFTFGDLVKPQTPGEWVVDLDHSTTTVPQQVSFRLRKTYSNHVPKLYYRATDIEDRTLLVETSVDGRGVFSYSENNGKKWKTVKKDGVIPNKKDLLLRVQPRITIKQDQKVELKDS